MARTLHSNQGKQPGGRGFMHITCPAGKTKDFAPEPEFLLINTVGAAGIGARRTTVRFPRRVYRAQHARPAMPSSFLPTQGLP